MAQNSSGIATLNWHALVAEAMRRRKAEKLTQRQHAALASVSIPTIVAFDRGERTLSLAKAFDILRVVGLIDEPKENGAQEAFIKEALSRWQELIENLPQHSPARFPYGWYRIDYALEGDLKSIELHELQALLKKVKVHRTGWPMFWIPHREELTSKEREGILACWLAPGDGNIDKPFYDAAHCDFWAATPRGQMFLIRGYQEDAQETFPPGTIFDPGLPIWRISEGLTHAARLAKLLKRDKGEAINIHFRAFYSGLSGRVLRAWANPLSDLLVEGTAARSNEAILETVVPDTGVEQNLAAYVFPLVASLYERFSISGLSINRVQMEVERFQSNPHYSNNIIA